MRVLRYSASAIGTAAMCLALSHSAMSETKKPGTIGLALTYFAVAMYETADTKEECPQGLVIGDEEQFTTKFPNKEDQLERLALVPSRDARGKDGANDYWFPMSADADPVPHRMPVGDKGFGLNLDGTPDGAGTSKTCKHDKLKDPTSGDAGIDNQLARLVGCGLMFRGPGLIGALLHNDTLEQPMRWLIEINNVDDEKNDDSVDVNLYLAQDPIRWSVSNEAVPFNSQRIDERFPQYMAKAHGKIVDGVLITDPIEQMKWPYRAIFDVKELAVQDMRLRVKLTPTGGEGYIAGYMDTERWWRSFTKWGAHSVSTKMAAPNMYRAMQDLADGHKDAAGKCSSMSAAYTTKWVRTFVVHPDQVKSVKRGGEKLAAN